MNRQFKRLLSTGVKSVPVSLLPRTSIFRSTGWFASYRSARPVDGQGNAIPWLTYPFMSFLASRTGELAGARIYEYGAGSSTLWWSAHAESVLAVEHDRGWFDKVALTMPANGEVLYRPLGSPANVEQYVNSIAERSENYNMVVVDGRERVRCAEAATRCLSDDGVIVWDNSERERYATGKTELHKLGFREIAFTGLTPCSLAPTSTSLFYRENNFIGI